MGTTINADTSNGLQLTSDSSGTLELQSDSTTIATVNSDGLTVAGSITTDMPVFAMTNSGSNQTIADNVATKVNLDTVLTDTNNAIDTANSKIVIPSGHGGIYQINYSLRIDSGANSQAGSTLAYLYINGVQYNRVYFTPMANYGRAFHMTRSSIIELSDGDELELYGQMDRITSGSPFINFSIDYTELSGFKLR